jgi:predicted Zn-dependent protease with MMP-like domain
MLFALPKLSDRFLHVMSETILANPYQVLSFETPIWLALFMAVVFAVFLALPFVLLHQEKKRRRNAERFVVPDLPELEELERRAVEIVTQVSAEMPVEIRDQVQKTACVMNDWHPRLKEGSFESGFILGLYEPLQEWGDQPEGRIHLFLGTIYLYSKRDLEVFDSEVRKTFLHEVGHHFDWDEEEVAARGLA